MKGIHIEYLLSCDIFYYQSVAFEDLPYHRIQDNATLVFSGKGLGDVESSHSAEFLLFFEEEELVGLHQELAAYLAVVVYYQVAYLLFVEFFPYCKPGGTCSDYCNSGFVYLYFSFMFFLFFRKVGVGDALYIFDSVCLGYTDPPHFPVYKHLTCPAFAYAAFQCAFSVVQTVFVNNESCLVKGCCYGEAFAALHFLSFKSKLGILFFRDREDGMFGNLVHIVLKFEFRC